MRVDSIALEEDRLNHVRDVESYGMLHERHRIFPAIFEKRDHHRILDVAAGVGVVGARIRDWYRPNSGEFSLLCNDICPKCLEVMNRSGLATASFDIDSGADAFPLDDGAFDAVIALATIEHTIHTRHFVSELHRILCGGGYLYLSAPNYSGLPYLVPFLLSGKTFHDPLNEDDQYEFFAHVRYFTYRTLVEFVSPFGFALDAVYLPLPEQSSRYRRLVARSPLQARLVRLAFQVIYRIGSPRWASEPVLCFTKSAEGSAAVNATRKVII